MRKKYAVIVGDRRSIIVGLDPGTTAGYAVLDIQGMLVETGSGKDLPLDMLIKKLAEIGHIILVGCDKARVPDLVCSFATKVGAKIVCPDEDLLVGEKRKLTEQWKYGNVHSMDALASALFAWKHVESVLGKIDAFLAREKKSEMADAVKVLVIKKNRSIKAAVMEMEKPVEKDKLQTKVSREEKLPTAKEVARLRASVQVFKEKNALIKQENQDVALRLSVAMKEIARLEKQLKIVEDKNRLNERVALKEKRIVSLSGEVVQKDAKIEELRQQNAKLFQLLSLSKDHVIMPRLKSLGWQEFSNRTARFPINDDGVLFVDDPFSFSEQTIAELRSKHTTILSAKEAKSNPLGAQGLVLLNVRDIQIELYPSIAVVKKVDLERKRREKSVLYDIVEEYQKERGQNG